MKCGLWYLNGARYYDPTLRRFITPDTIVQSPYDPQSLNRYAYCRNNPLIYIDPTGNSWVSETWKRNKVPITNVVGAIVTAATYVASGGQFVVTFGYDTSGEQNVFHFGIFVAGVPVFQASQENKQWSVAGQGSWNFSGHSNQKKTPSYHSLNSGEGNTYNTQLPGYTEVLMRADYARDKESSMNGAAVYLSTTKIGKSRFDSAMEVYWSALTSNLAGVPNIPSNPEDAVGVGLLAGSRYYQGKALAHSAGRGLMYPTKSSIYRGLMGKSAMLGKASMIATVLQIGWAEYIALKAEWEYVNGR